MNEIDIPTVLESSVVTRAYRKLAIANEDKVECMETSFNTPYSSVDV